MRPAIFEAVGSSFLLFAATAISACASTPPPLAPATSSKAAPVADAPASAEPRPPLRAAPYGSPERLAGWVDAYVSALGKRWGEAYAFTGYVAIARDGALVFGKGYGSASRETGAVPDADTRFRIGSMTKQFTAVAVMQLVERGKLRVEDRVDAFVPGLSPAVGAVTLHQLLTHTSGIASYTDDAALMSARGRAHATAEVLATFKDAPLAFTPGDRFDYSNSNYFLLGLVIEKVTGRSYEAHLQESLFRPAAMRRTSTIDAPSAANTATGYMTGDDDVRALATPVDMSLPFAAGALRSTANDLVAWDRALAGEKLLSAASKKRLFTVAKGDYAYGFAVSRVDGVDVQSHGGGIDGFSSFLARVPRDELVVIALSNDAAFAAERVAAPALKMAITGEPIAPPEEREIAPMDRAVAASAEGEYDLSSESRKEIEGKLPAAVIASIVGLAITREGDRLFMKPTGQGRLELFRATDGWLFAKKGGIHLAVEAAEAKPAKSNAKPAPARAVSILQTGAVLRYVRKGAAPAKGGATTPRLPSR